MAGGTGSNTNRWLLLHARVPPGEVLTVSLNGEALEGRSALGHNPDERGWQPYCLPLPPDLDPGEALTLQASHPITHLMLSVR